MEIKNDSRTPRRKNMDKKGLEHSIENRRCSEDAIYNHSSMLGPDPEPSGIGVNRVYLGAQNPVLISKNKLDYISLTNKNKTGKLLKVGLPTSVYTSAELKYFETNKAKGLSNGTNMGSNKKSNAKKMVSNLNGESDGSYLPFISTDYEDRKKFAEEQSIKYDRTSDRFAADASLQAEFMSMEAEGRGDGVVKFEPMHIKNIKNIQTSKLPSIGRTRHGHPDNGRKHRERDKENDENKNGLVVMNSRPMDVDTVGYYKNSSMTSSPTIGKGSIMQSKGKQKITGKVQEFKLFVGPTQQAYMRERAKKQEGVDDSRISNADNSFVELSPTKDDGNDLNKSQNIESLMAVYRQNSDGMNERTHPIISSTICIRSLVHKKVEEESDDNANLPVRRNSLLKGKLASTLQPERIKDKGIRNSKVLSPTATRVSQTFARESTSNVNIGGTDKDKSDEQGNRCNTDGDENQQLTLTSKGTEGIEKNMDLMVSSAITHERSVERKNYARYAPRNRGNNTQAPNQSNTNRHSLNLTKESSEKNQQEAFSTVEKPSKVKNAIAKNAIKTISNIAKTNEKSSQRPAPLALLPFDKDNPMFKYQSFLDYIYRISFTFATVCRPPPQQTTYKFFVGKGNNGLMIRSLLKTRWWWLPTDSAESTDLNLCWTQLRNNKVIESMKTRKKVSESNSINSALDTSLNTNANTNDTYSERNVESVNDMTDSDSDVNSIKSAVESRVKPKHRSKKAGANEKQSDSSDMHNRVFTKAEYNDFVNFFSSNKKKILYAEDAEDLVKASRKSSSLMTVSDPTKIKICNHMESNFHLSNKKALFYNMRAYYEAIKEDVFNYLPLTFHIQKGTEDKEWTRFLEYYNAREKEVQDQEKLISEADANDKKALVAKRIRNIWILKPGENTNRGQGIKVASDLPEITQTVNSGDKHVNGKVKTYIIQQYLDRPLLYSKRKFDIRCYMMVCTVNGYMKGYWYQDGYIRTSSKEFSLKNLQNKMVHLTNDAVQKKSEEYGKFENGNKVSYVEFQKYIDAAMPETKANFFTDVYPQMKNMARDTVRAVYGKMDPFRRENTFEVFGLDFMIDINFKPWLIEVNTNPCLELSAPLLARIIPTMVENALRLAVDPLFPPPLPPGSKKQQLPDNMLENNKFELIYDDFEDGPYLRSVLLSSNSNNETQAAMDQIFEEEEEESDSEGTTECD